MILGVVAHQCAEGVGVGQAQQGRGNRFAMPGRCGRQHTQRGGYRGPVKSQIVRLERQGGGPRVPRLEQQQPAIDVELRPVRSVGPCRLEGPFRRAELLLVIEGHGQRQMDRMELRVPLVVESAWSTSWIDVK